MKIIRKFYPLILTIFFSVSIYIFFQNDFKEFNIFNKFTFNLIISVIFLSFFYLLTEALVLKNIIVFLKKKTNLLETLALMSSTYLFNSAVQLSGLGFRVAYLKEKKFINIKSFLFLSISSIFIELLVFSSFGLVVAFIIDQTLENILIANQIKFVFFLIAFCSFFYLFLLIFFLDIVKATLKKLNLSIAKKLINFLTLLKQENLFIFHARQLLVFAFQYIILSVLFLIILKSLNNNYYFYNALLTASLVDLSFVINLTPFSIGISEALTYFGTRDTNLGIIEIIFLINTFRIGIMLVSLILSPLYFLNQFYRKK
jgi:hypothetical protein